MNIFLSLISIIVICFLFSNLTKKIKIPSVVSLILVGLILTFDGFRNIFVGDNIDIISAIGDIGLFSLMFLAGLESSIKTLIKEEKDSFFIALFGAIFPFILGFIVFYFLFDFSLIISFIIGLSMSITAEATKAKVLLDLNKLKTRIGSAMIGAGLIDDFLGLMGFSIFMFSIGILTLKEHYILFGVLISFFIGLFTQKYARHHHITKKIEKMLNTFLVPFFFISMGVHFDLFSLLVSYKLVSSIILIAIIGKLFGTFLAKPFVNFSYKQLHLIGWAMNSRGAIELALALIAFRSGLIDQFIYSSLILMALVTTIFFPFIISYMIKKNSNIMD